MRVRPPRICARPARQGCAIQTPADFRLRPPTARKAESAPGVRHDGGPIPALLPGGAKKARHDRVEPPADAGIAAGQRRLPDGVCRKPRQGPVPGHPRPFQCQRPPDGHPFLGASPGDIVEVRAGSRRRTYFKGFAEAAESRTAPTWLNRDLEKLSGNLVKLPERHELSDIRLNEQLIVEFYSR